MFKRLKCRACDRKIKKNFQFCPNCGVSLKGKVRRQEDNGLLGINDLVGDIKMPFGLNGIMKNLVKQLDKELGGMDLSNLQGNNGQPNKGFKIQISTGKPQSNNVMPKSSEVPSFEEEFEKISEKEITRRQKLKKVEAVSTIRRLPEGIVYEISTPGVKNRKEVVIAKLEDALEVRAYSKDKCYEKIIPIKAELIGYVVKDEKVLLKLKG